MDTKLIIELVIINILMILIIYHNLKKEKILLKYALVWFASCFLMIICALTPNLMIQIANFLGIEKASNMIFLFAIGINLIITFILTIMVSNQKSKITTLVEEIGIIKEEMRHDK